MAKDLQTELVNQGIVVVHGEINHFMAMETIAQIQYLDKTFPNRPIQLWIDSPGGDVNAGLAIYDILNHVSVEIHTFAIGLAASMGAFLLSAGTRGKRYAFPNTEIMIHQPSSAAQGQATDISIAAEHLSKIKKRMNSILANNTGKSEEQIKIDTERDYFMFPQEAKEYGIIDEIMDFEKIPKAWRQE